MVKQFQLLKLEIEGMKKEIAQLKQEPSKDKEQKY